MKKRNCWARRMGMLFCIFILLGGAGRVLGADSFYVITGSGNSTDITKLKSDVATLQSKVAALQGQMFPYGLVNMYEDATVKIVLTGESKTVTDLVNHYTKVALRLLVTNKTASNIYLGYEYYTSSVVDEHGMGQFERAMNGIKNIWGTESNGNNFSAIGPNSTVTVEWISKENDDIFYDSHYITASFGFVLFKNAGNTRFNAGFTGIHLP